MIGEVYFAQIGRGPYGPVKIGFSEDVDRRLKQLSTVAKQPARLLTSVPASRRTEYYLHRVLAPWRIKGEWYRASKTVLSCVTDVQKNGLGNFPDEALPLVEFDVAATTNEQIVEQCREYCLLIAGHRAPTEHMRELIERVAALSDIPYRTIKAIWYREKTSISAAHFQTLQDLYQASIATEMVFAPWIRDDRGQGQ